jgi:hypothetical protein
MALSIPKSGYSRFLKEGAQVYLEHYFLNLTKEILVL